MKILKRVNVYTRLSKRDRQSLTKKASATGGADIYVFDAAHLRRPNCFCGCLNDKEHAAKESPIACVRKEDFKDWVANGRAAWPAALATGSCDLFIVAAEAIELRGLATLKATCEPF